MPSGSDWAKNLNSYTAKVRRGQRVSWKDLHPKSDYLRPGETDISDEEWRARYDAEEEANEFF